MTSTVNVIRESHYLINSENYIFLSFFIVKTTSPIVPPVFTASSSFGFVIILNMRPLVAKSYILYL